MLFNSLDFLIFFPIVVGLYFLIPHKYRWVLLLLSSYYFYMVWNPKYIVLIILSTFIDYFCSICMGKCKEKSHRKKYLYISLFSNLGLLFLFKYFNFLNGSLRTVFTHFNLNYCVPNFKLLLPMGISFYTFQTLSYTIDVYRGNIKPEKHFGIFALYVSFFPQLVAGPIERSERLLPQFNEKHTFNYRRVTDGLKRMAWGFFKKVVIADRLAILVNTVYNNPTNYKGISLVVATIFFAFQIFCDFSGYSDIAIGSAQVMGFELMENFNRPYFSKSISEFWKRWHISLSTWFRDYLYIPLGGNRVKVSRHYFNLFFTFLVSGLWHGANWTFVTWGALHGVYLILGILFKPIKEMIAKVTRIDKVPFLHKMIKIFITFNLVVFAWIFFRANNMHDAIYIVNNLFVDITNWTNIQYVKSSILNLGLNNFEFIIAILSLIVMELIHTIQRSGSVIKSLQKRNLVLRWAVYYGILFFIVVFGVFSNSEFIYFQF